MPLVKSKLVCASRLSQISGVENAECDESKVSAASLLLIILICVEKFFFSPILDSRVVVHRLHMRSL